MPFDKINNIIAVAAGKGGVGKSSIAVNLALALQQKGRAVGLIDTDLYGPSLQKILPADRLPIQKEKYFEPAFAQGIKTISMAYFQEEANASAVRAPIANRVIGQFLNQTNWGELDDLIIDFPPGTGDIQLTLCQQAHLSGAIMVTTPQQLAVADVKKAVNLFDKVHVPILGVFENMSYYQHEATGEKVHLLGRGGGERLAREIGAPFLGQAPMDPDFARYCDNGQNLFIQKPNCPLAKGFISLAEAALKQLDEIKSQQGKRLENFDVTWKEMSHAH
ncbi:Iron-sulfur protein NUBPL [Chlamydiales bacterium SCGC AG-110-M15]|nr:Iron-sulfur protein NUBPL [Chlamydiales bacterium SCGC AG-110-M15]